MPDVDTFENLGVIAMPLGTADFIRSVCVMDGSRLLIFEVSQRCEGRPNAKDGLVPSLALPVNNGN